MEYLEDDDAGSSFFLQGYKITKFDLLAFTSVNLLATNHDFDNTFKGFNIFLDMYISRLF